MILLPILALAAASIDPQIAKAAAKAKPVVTCVVGADCDRKWARARRWVSENSKLAIAVDTQTMIATNPPFYPAVESAVVVTLVGQGSERAINLRVWCRNVIVCQPSSKAGTELFRQAMADASEPLR